MSLIDVCHDLMREVALSISSSSFSRRSSFVILDHSVDNEEFVVKIYFDKEQFEHLIDQYVKEMLDELKQNKNSMMQVGTFIIFLLIGLKPVVITLITPFF